MVISLMFCWYEDLLIVACFATPLIVMSVYFFVIGWMSINPSIDLNDKNFVRSEIFRGEHSHSIEEYEIKGAHQQFRSSPDPIVFNTALSANGVLAFALVMNLLWIGASIDLAWKYHSYVTQGKPVGYITPFLLIPYVAFGYYVLSLGVHAILQYFSATFKVTLTQASLTMGQPAEFRWICESKMKHVSNLNIKLVGAEVFSINDDETTHDFYEKILCNTADPTLIAGHAVQFTIPNPTMHSWEYGAHEIRWSIDFETKNSFGVEIDLRFPFEVLALANPNSLPLANEVKLGIMYTPDQN